MKALARGILVWGARTVSSDPEWKYVSIRRLIIHVEESIKKGTRLTGFEPNNEHLWVRVREAVSVFLYEIWRQGMMTGNKPGEAYL